jgi:uncharacterized protein (DUF433 family)
MDTIAGHIEISPGVAGGKPRITGHRITAQDIALWHERLDLSADEIATEYGLSLAEVYAALGYYHDRREEIDRAIRSAESFIAELRSRIRSRMRATLRGWAHQVLPGRARAKSVGRGVAPARGGCLEGPAGRHPGSGRTSGIWRSRKVRAA